MPCCQTDKASFRRPLQALLGNICTGRGRVVKMTGIAYLAHIAGRPGMVVKLNVIALQEFPPLSALSCPLKCHIDIHCWIPATRPPPSSRGHYTLPFHSEWKGKKTSWNSIVLNSNFVTCNHSKIFISFHSVSCNVCLLSVVCPSVTVWLTDCAQRSGPGRICYLYQRTCQQGRVCLPMRDFLIRPSNQLCVHPSVRLFMCAAKTILHDREEIVPWCLWYEMTVWPPRPSK
jgi:hypothetical protein